MRNYKLIIAYDGSNYSGWQRLPDGKRTIQGIVENKISEWLGYEIVIHGSGRTDAGVHANGQVANFKVAGKIEEEIFYHEINEQLPEDIRIKEVELVKNSFHSRLSAVAKRYVYTIDMRDKPDVFARRYTYHFPEKLDIEQTKKAAELLEGTHDFSGFCDKKEEKSGVRTIYKIHIREEKQKLILEYYGSGFLNHMVRILTGTLLEIGTDQKQVEDINRILESRARADAGFTAPARGLRLEEVYYD